MQGGVAITGTSGHDEGSTPAPATPPIIAADAATEDCEDAHLLELRALLSSKLAQVRINAEPEAGGLDLGLKKDGAPRTQHWGHRVWHQASHAFDDFCLGLGLESETFAFQLDLTEGRVLDSPVRCGRGSVVGVSSGMERKCRGEGSLLSVPWHGAFIFSGALRCAVLL